MSLFRLHMFSSDEPIKEGITRTAICGMVVPNAVFAFMFDGQRMPDGDAVFSVCCQKCASSAVSRYLYGIIPGEESLHDPEAA